jgi:glyoxylase-like metal-dependent hydrolase (beta-lactamase superfamily II)
MTQQVPLGDDARADVVRDDGTHEVTQDLAYRRTIFVNVVFCGLPGADRWVLIDTGLQGSSGMIEKTIAERFGHDSRPAAIVLTHGHFDHVGSLEYLASRWGVPIYAHPLEFPYLDGRAAYPDPDPGVGGGLMARLSPFFPKGPVDVSRWLNPLPEDGTVPGMPGWRWLHTPGHTPGHVSFWRAEDRTLVAGDAFITTATESAYSAVTQSPEMHGPPRYFTQNWEQAHVSVQMLTALQPEVVLTGHGHAMRGADMRRALQTLARDFNTLAVPPRGRYVAHPARAEDGSAYPPAKRG